MIPPVRIAIVARREPPQQAVLQDWRTSDLRVRRAGYQSLTFAIKLGYFEDDRVRAFAGFTPGCNLPQDGRPPGLGTRHG